MLFQKGNLSLKCGCSSIQANLSSCSHCLQMASVFFCGSSQQLGAVAPSSRWISGLNLERLDWCVDVLCCCVVSRMRPGSLCWASTWSTTGPVRTCGRPAWSTTPSSGWSGPSHRRRTSSLTTSPWAPSSDTGQKRHNTHTHTLCRNFRNIASILCEKLSWKRS